MLIDSAFLFAVNCLTAIQFTVSSTLRPSLPFPCLVQRLHRQVVGQLPRGENAKGARLWQHEGLHLGDAAERRQSGGGATEAAPLRELVKHLALHTLALWHIT